MSKETEISKNPTHCAGLQRSAWWRTRGVAISFYPESNKKWPENLKSQKYQKSQKKQRNPQKSDTLRRLQRSAWWRTCGVAISFYPESDKEWPFLAPLFSVE